MNVQRDLACIARFQSHLRSLKYLWLEVLNRLDKAGLTLKLAKCEFGTDECEYLGHKIEKEELHH